MNLSLSDQKKEKDDLFHHTMYILLVTGLASAFCARVIYDTQLSTFQSFDFDFPQIKTCRHIFSQTFLWSHA